MVDPASPAVPEPDRWRISDELWRILEPLFEELDPPRRSGRQRHPPRALLDAILYRAITGAPWSSLPASYPDDSSVHRAFQRWRRLGIMDRVWSILLEQYWPRGGQGKSS